MLLLQAGPQPRGLLGPAREHEARELVHELFVLMKTIRRQKNRTMDKMWRAVQIAKRLAALKYNVVVLYGTNVIGCTDPRYNPDRWQLKEEYQEPITEQQQAIQHYLQMKAEIAAMPLAEVQAELTERRRQHYRQGAK